MKIKAAVEQVINSELVRVNPPLLGRDIVRLAGIHTPVVKLHGMSQGAPAEESLAFVEAHLRSGTKVTLETDAEVFDKYFRPLVYLRREKQNFNVEMVRQGHAVMYPLFPNVNYLEQLQEAQIEALEEERAMFDGREPIAELPYEFRWRAERRNPNKFVGDLSRMVYVDPTEYKMIRLENRLFFYDEDDAIAAGFGRVTPGQPDVRRYIEKDYLDMSLEELLAQPLWVFKGITKEQAESAKKYLGIWTVGDLANNRQFNWAKIIRRFSP
jgi:endonuclease YncB( thermonuclease family)